MHNEKQNAEKDRKKKGEEKKAETVEAGSAAHDKAWAFQTLDHTYCQLSPSPVISEAHMSGAVQKPT